MTAQHTPGPIFLAENTRFKLCFNKAGNATNFHGWQSVLEGRWVALVPAEDDAHMELYAFRRQSLKLRQVERQRDELLDALQELLPTLEDQRIDARARAAIAKATGGKI